MRAHPLISPSPPASPQRWSQAARTPVLPNEPSPNFEHLSPHHTANPKLPDEPNFAANQRKKNQIPFPKRTQFRLLKPIVGPPHHEPYLRPAQNRFLKKKSSPNSPFSSLSATTDHCLAKAHSTLMTCGLLCVTLVM